jgi:lysophospholipase L1-like esterase
MKINRYMLIITFMGIICSFVYGMATIKYNIFPYQLLKSLTKTSNTNQKFSNLYYHKKSFFEQHGRDDYDVVFIGDSITDMAEWQDLFPALKVANRGIGGDTTEGVLERLNSIYSTKAKQAILMLGINDIASGLSIDTISENYQDIVKKLLAHDMEVYVQSTLLTGKNSPYARLNSKVVELNESLKKFSNDYKHVTYIDINMGLTNNSLLDGKYSRDGVHLNGMAYLVWKNLLVEYLH